MYVAMVTLLLFVLPAGSVIIEHLAFPGDASLLALIGKWFVFWAAGVRLLLAGLRQIFQPRFTAEEIFRIKSDEPLPIVRELGMANLSLAIIGVLSLARPDFVLPVAIAAAIYYGLAGLGHVMRRERSANETFAMVSDLFVFGVLAASAAAIWG